MDWRHEVWAEALWVEQHYGADGPKFIAERITALAEHGDHAGVARWRRIAGAYDQLRIGSSQ